MSQNPITLYLPEDVYENVRRLAEESNRPVETVLLESMDLLFGDMTTRIHLSVLSRYTDAQLWAIVHRRLSSAQLIRRGELDEKGKTGRLSAEEEREIDQLVQSSDQLMLLRSKALRILQNRGHDITGYLGMGG